MIIERPGALSSDQNTHSIYIMARVTRIITRSIAASAPQLQVKWQINASAFHRRSEICPDDWKHKAKTYATTNAVERWNQTTQIPSLHRNYNQVYKAAKQIDYWHDYLKWLFAVTIV